MLGSSLFLNWGRLLEGRVLHKGVLGCSAPEYLTRVPSSGTRTIKRPNFHLGKVVKVDIKNNFLLDLYMFFVCFYVLKLAVS